MVPGLGIALGTAFLVAGALASNTCGGSPSTCTPSAANNETRFLRTLFSNYQADIPPLVQGQPLQVGVALKLLKVDVDIHLAQLQVNAFFRLSWLDDRLLFNGSDVTGSKWSTQADFLSIEAMDGLTNQLWVPDIVCETCESVHLEDQGAYIYDSSFSTEMGSPYPFNVFYSRPIKFTAPCKWELTAFPFDLPECDVDFWSWMRPGSKLNVLAVESEIDRLPGDIGSAEYKYRGAAVSRSDNPYTVSGKEMSWPKVRYHLNLVRRQETYIVNIIVPLAVMVLLANLVFVLPLKEGQAGSGERIGYAVTLFLTIIAICLFTSGLRPAVSESIWMDRYQIRCVILTMIPICETMVVFYMKNITDDATAYYNTQASQSFKVGENVRVRSSTAAAWRHGCVTQKKPMLVLAEGDDVARTWLHVEKHQDKALDEQGQAEKNIRTSASLRAATTYDEFMRIHAVLRFIDKTAARIGLRTNFANHLSWRGIDQTLRHIFPIVCFAALSDLYAEVDPIFKSSGFSSNPLFGGLTLVGTDLKSGSGWDSVVFILQGLWFLYSSVHLGVWLLYNVAAVIIRAVQRQRARAAGGDLQSVTGSEESGEPPVTPLGTVEVVTAPCEEVPHNDEDDQMGEEQARAYMPRTGVLKTAMFSS